MARILMVALTEIKFLVKFYKNNFTFRVLLVFVCFFIAAAASVFFVVVGVGHRRYV